MKDFDCLTFHHGKVRAIVIQRAPTHPESSTRRKPGESLLRVDASETGRRACLRVIDAVTMCDPSRKHDLSLWFAVHHTGRGEPFRMLKLKRRV